MMDDKGNGERLIADSHAPLITRQISCTYVTVTYPHLSRENSMSNPVVSSWYHVGIDFIGPLQPPSTQGSHYILTISDYFTKYVLAIPTETKYASGVVDALFQVY
jgi:hypothetical protein